jgi:hypothetical protein
VSLEEHIAEQRDAKATTVVRWLIAANTTHRRCRRCAEPVTRDEEGRWVVTTQHGLPSLDCGAPGFRRTGAHVPHVADVWTVQRIAAAPPDLRKEIARLAGLKRPCSPETWDRVVVLYQARVEADRRLR